MLDTKICREYAEQMDDGVQFPPIEVYFDEKKYWVADGFLRLHAWLSARGGSPILAVVHRGDRSDALWHAIGANHTHGLRRTNADKRKATALALLHPQGCQMSDAQIAEHVGVSRQNVSNVRKELERNAAIRVCNVRTTKNGGTRTVRRADASATRRRGPFRTVKLSHTEPQSDAVEIRNIMGESYLRELVRRAEEILSEN